MTEFWNFTNNWYVVQQFWLWILLAIALGIVVGWTTCERRGG